MYTRYVAGKACGPDVRDGVAGTLASSTMSVHSHPPSGRERCTEVVGAPAQRGSPAFLHNTCESMGQMLVATKNPILPCKNTNAFHLVNKPFPHGATTHYLTGESPRERIEIPSIALDARLACMAHNWWKEIGAVPCNLQEQRKGGKGRLRIRNQLTSEHSTSSTHVLCPECVFSPTVPVQTSSENRGRKQLPRALFQHVAECKGSSAVSGRADATRASSILLLILFPLSLGVLAKVVLDGAELREFKFLAFCFPISLPTSLRLKPTRTERSSS
jgi:hypothetical protein